MVRKVMVMACVLVLSFALCVTAQAATHSVYDGSFSNTYVTYFRDIVSGIGFNENYVAFRSGQYEYTMVVGELSFDGQTILLSGTGTEYVFASDSNYNSSLEYHVTSVSDFSVTVNNSILYTDLGNYPQLVERGAKYEMLSAVLLSVALLCVAIGRFFGWRGRR